ncbi:MAG: hypothetical protein ACREHC_06385 [Candidatus Levyibacteriota bacterium]
MPVTEALRRPFVVKPIESSPTANAAGEKGEHAIPPTVRGVESGDPRGSTRPNAQTTVEALLRDSDSLFVAPKNAEMRTPKTYSMPSGDE